MSTSEAHYFDTEERAARRARLDELSDALFLYPPQAPNVPFELMSAKLARAIAHEDTAKTVEAEVDILLATEGIAVKLEDLTDEQLAELERRTDEIKQLQIAGTETTSNVPETADTEPQPTESLAQRALGMAARAAVEHPERSVPENSQTINIAALGDGVARALRENMPTTAAPDTPNADLGGGIGVEGLQPHPNKQPKKKLKAKRKPTAAQQAAHAAELQAYRYRFGDPDNPDA